VCVHVRVRARVHMCACACVFACAFANACVFMRVKSWLCTYVCVCMVLYVQGLSETLQHTATHCNTLQHTATLTLCNTRAESEDLFF